MTMPVSAVLGYTAQELTMWRITLGIGAVVIAVVILLLSFLVKIVKDIDAGVADVLDAAVGVAGNTSHLNGLLTTNDAVVAIKKEAMRHAALLELDHGVLEVDDQPAHLVTVQLPARERVHHGPVLQGEPVGVAQRHL